MTGAVHAPGERHRCSGFPLAGVLSTGVRLSTDRGVGVVAAGRTA
ncbi:hypothetical protein LI90_4092 [Carbonactinospora thermoautotrophica]|uniref:Uncharacterized protein n=1 Tax=Carbonactinospora thermoautotrophica TaxID=1469144 RepID=A0A132N0B0_9ACTN|nr:hypothetical protein LI90_4092 [Carbonactinospora thermoautotrophica]